jgi:hypothetical protein
MIRFEQTFMNFLLYHQEKHNRTYHFLILMDALISAAKHIEHYYLTGALKGNLGLAGTQSVRSRRRLSLSMRGAAISSISIHWMVLQTFPMACR